MVSSVDWQTTQCFLLAGQAACLSDSPFRTFWEVWPQVWRAAGKDPAAWVPALTATVRCEWQDWPGRYDGYVFRSLAQVPLPEMLPGKVSSWHADLLNAWKARCRRDREEVRVARTLALVRLDGGRRRRMLMNEARRVRELRDDWERAERLAALSAWRPAQGAADDWIAFWWEVRQTWNVVEKTVAAQALLNAAAGARVLPVAPDRLLGELAESVDRLRGTEKRLLLYWSPEPWLKTLPDAVGNVARRWLGEAETGGDGSGTRQSAWELLVNWDRTGILHNCGIELLPCVVRAVKKEREGDVLWALARWEPAPDSTPDPSLLRELEEQWRHHSGDKGDWMVRRAGWRARLALRQAGAAAEATVVFREACLEAVANEDNESVLLVLALWAPKTDAPPKMCRDWQQGGLPVE